MMEADLQGCPYGVPQDLISLYHKAQDEGLVGGSLTRGNQAIYAKCIAREEIKFVFVND